MTNEWLYEDRLEKCVSNINVILLIQVLNRLDITDIIHIHEFEYLAVNKYPWIKKKVHG